MLLIALADDSTAAADGDQLTWTYPGHRPLAPFALPASRFRLAADQPLDYAPVPPWLQLSKRSRLAAQLALHYSRRIVAVAATPAGFGPANRCALIVLGSNGYLGVLCVDAAVKAIVELADLTSYAVPAAEESAMLGTLQPRAIAVAWGFFKTTRRIAESFSALLAVSTSTPRGHVALFSLARDGRALLVGGFDLGIDLAATALAFAADFRLAAGDTRGTVSLWDVGASPRSLLLRPRLIRVAEFTSCLPRPVTALAWGAGCDVLAVARGSQLAALAWPARMSDAGGDGGGVVVVGNSTCAVERPSLQEPPCDSATVSAIAWIHGELAAPLLLALDDRGSLQARRVLLPSAALLRTAVEDVCDAGGASGAFLAMCACPLRLSVRLATASRLVVAPSRIEPALRFAAVVDATRSRGYCLRGELALLAEPPAVAPDDEFWTAVVKCARRGELDPAVRDAMQRMHARAMLQDASETGDAALGWVRFANSLQPGDARWGPSVESLQRLAALVPAQGDAALSDGGERVCAWTGLAVARDATVLRCALCGAEVDAAVAGVKGDARLPALPHCPLCCVAGLLAPSSLSSDGRL